MSFWEAVMLGFVQGLTEFLPVSSSGHLVIIQSFIKDFRQPGVLFDAMLHLGTLMAVVFFLRKEIFDIIMSLMPTGWFREKRSVSGTKSGRRIALYVVIATICTGVIGLLFEDRIHQLFTSPRTVSVMLLITGGLLFMTDRFKGEGSGRDINLKDSLVIGVVQGMSLIPGISRSGSTIAFGIFRGLDGASAARFSFLLSIPAVLAALIFELRYVESVPLSDIRIYFAGTIAAAITGFLTLGLLLFMIRKRKLRVFAYYCWILGISTLLIKLI